MMRNRTEERNAMVKSQLKIRGLFDRRVLTAMLYVPRELFIPPEYQDYAYEDFPVPIGYGQTISQPYIVGFMLEALGLSGTERVLEIGSGSGYQTALLSKLSREVWSIERIRGLHERAARILVELDVSNVHLALGDGYLGMPEEAPFDAVIVSAAPPEVPEALLRQLKNDGGILVCPVGPAGCQRLVRITRNGGTFESETLMDVAFVPLVHGRA